MPDPTPPLVLLEGITRSFGAVKALRGVDLAIRPGECVGLVGHNGAGKSTLMNILAGVLRHDGGRFAIGGVQQGAAGAPSPAAAGVGCVSQELLMAPNLTVAENARVLRRDLTGFGWRKRAARLMADSLDRIFPGHGIAPGDVLGEMPIAKRQMVEIARAFTGRDLRLMILDEPTSSLDARAAGQLLAYVEMRRREGLAVILITHLLGEVLAASSRVVVMRDGAVVLDRPATGLGRHDLVEAMGHVPVGGPQGPAAGRAATASRAAPCLTVAPATPGGLAFVARPGEVVGLAGLAGQGQTPFLHGLMAGKGAVTTSAPRAGLAFVAGDRKADGVLPAWSVKLNLTIGAMRSLARWGFIDGQREQDLTQSWRERIGVRTASTDTDIVTLSGGNQQKVLFARALATTAETILMDDPMRGVDIGTKTEVYRLIRQEAENGRCFVWYTTEMDELDHCDRVYVFRDGLPATELVGDAIDEASVVGASFSA